MSPLRRSFVYLVLALFVAACIVSAQTTSGPTRKAPPPPPPPATDQQQFVAYWTTETGWKSELQLRNNMAGQDLVVTPSLRLAGDGAETALAPVTIKPQEVTVINLDTALGTTATQLIGTYGSLVLRYRSSDYRNLYAVLMIHKIGHPLAFHIDGFGEEQDYDAGSREGIWWLPNDTASDYLILTNQGGNTIPLDLSLYDASGKMSTQKILLGSRETTRYSVRKLVQAAHLSGSYGGIKISTPSHAGSLDTLHLLYDETAGFSATLKMFDHDPNSKLEQRDYAKTAVWTLRAPMLALSNPDPALAFPPGTVLRPQLFIRNTTAKPVDAALRFNWRSAGGTGKAVGPSLHLNPYETRCVDVAALQSSGLFPKEANWASVTLTTNTSPDEVMAVAASYDSTLRYGAQTPFSDQLTFRWEGSMWEYDPYHDSIITAGNGGTKPTQAAFTIFYNQGTEKYELEQNLQPDEQMWIDVGRLIREHVPDKNGKTLPSTLTMGSYEFRDLTNVGIGGLFEGKVIYDKTYGHVAYGCGFCCSYQFPRFSDDPLGVFFQNTAQNSVLALESCTNMYYDVSGNFWNNWSTVDTTIATVANWGVHTGMNPGSTTSNTHGPLIYGTSRLCPSSLRYPRGGVNVTPTVSVSCTPTDLALGSGPSDTTGGSCTTQQAYPPGGSFSWSVNKSTVTLNATSGASISYSANSASSSQGDTTISVIYTVNGQSATATSSQITTHQPTSLTVLSDTTNPTAYSCSGASAVPCLANPGDGTCNPAVPASTCSYSSYLRTRQYSVVDQLGQQFANVGISAANATESLPVSTTCAGLTFTTHGAQTTTWPDDFWLCHTCCLPGGPGCTMQSAPTQVISVNGFQVRSETINWTCTNVSLTP